MLRIDLVFSRRASSRLAGGSTLSWRCRSRYRRLSRWKKGCRASGLRGRGPPRNMRKYHAGHYEMYFELANLRLGAIASVEPPWLLQFIPSRFLSSAAKSLEDMALYYGTMLPVPQERIIPINDGYELDLGSGRKVITVHTPGHSGGHYAFVTLPDRYLFCGDSLGHYIEEHDYIYPATPAPDFDLEKSLASARRLLGFQPQAFVFPHFGLSRDTVMIVEQFERQVRGWVELADGLAPEERTADRLGALFFDDVPGVSEAEASVLRGILAINAGGVLHYLAGTCSQLG